MGTKVLCGNPDHVPQFRPVSDVLRDIVRYYVIWACRSGSKTFLYGGLDSWVKSCSKARYETRLLGGSKDQSLLSYEAMKIFRDETDPLNSRLVRDIMQTKAEFINKSKVSILTASMTAVRGPHPQALKLDEVDEIDAEVYEAALSQPTSKYGHKAVLGMFSTNHNIMGQMDKALANAKERGHAIYKYCYDSETEVLTRGGWLKFKDVPSHYPIMSLNPTTHAVEWTSIASRIEYHYEGEMIHFKNIATDIMVTPNHRMYAKIGQTASWKFVPAKELITHKDFFFNRKSTWDKKRKDTIRIRGYSIPTSIFFPFMGWFLSEGCCRQNKRIKISQDKQKHPVKYQNILKHCHALSNYIPMKSLAAYPYSVEFSSALLHQYLSKFGDSLSKYIPDEIKNADASAISEFLYTFRLGDGTVSQRGQTVYYTSSRQMEADLGELILKTGKFPSYTIRPRKESGNLTYAVRELKSKTTRSYKNTNGVKWERVSYNDTVYCFELDDNHIMLTRRNGKCAWQGNCVWECLESCRDYNCSTCKLAALCPGKQMKGADGYYSIEDFIGKLETLSMSMLSRDWLGIKVGLGDTVYEQEWNEDRNLCSVSLRQVPVKLSVDFGGVSPFSVGVWQEAPTELGGKGTWIRVTELYMCSEGAYEGDTKNREGSVTNAQVIKRALMAPWAKLVDEIIPDNSRPDSIQEWREAFPHAKIIIVTKDIDGMIDRVKSALKPILGAPKMLINRICLHWRQEVLMYAVKNDKPIDKNNHCYDDQTEILTEHGWKLFRDLDRTERVASLDGDRGLIWVQPSNYVDYGHEGHMFRYSNRHFGFCVTPNHNMLAVRQFDAKKLKRYNPTFVPVVNIRTAVGINNKGRRKQASCWWIPMRCIPENKGSGNVPVDGYFLGFWLAEGCKSISGFGAKYVHVDNTNLDLLDKATKRAGYHQKPYMASSGCHRVSIRSDELYDLLPKQRSWEKRIPRWFMENADLYQLFQLYEGMMDGDGCWQKASSHYNTCSEGLAGDFQELLIRIGKYGTVRQIGNIGDVSMMHGREITSKHNQYRVIVNDNGSVYKKLDGRKLERIHYSGRIYCVVVEPHHTIMVRRNGSTMWCGQTMDDTGYFALAKLGEEEGVYIGTTKKDVMPE